MPSSRNGTREPDPRKYTNTSRDGSHFYLYQDNTILFDDGRGRNGSFMPPFDYQQTFACRDGSSFIFHPNGTGWYDNGQGNPRFIPAGSCVWSPPVSPSGSVATSSVGSVNGSAGSRPLSITYRPTPVVRRITEGEEESSDDDLEKDGYDDKFKFGYRRR